MNLLVGRPSSLLAIIGVAVFQLQVHTPLTGESEHRSATHDVVVPPLFRSRYLRANTTRKN